MDATVSGHARGWRAVRVGAVLTLVGTCLAACGTGNTAVATTPPVSTPTHASAPAGPAQPAGPPTITIKGNQATPAVIVVNGGTDIKIKNNDAISHNLEDIVHLDYDGDIPAHSTGDLTAPPSAGKYTYYDRNHRTVQFIVQVN